MAVTATHLGLQSFFQSWDRQKLITFLLGWITWTWIVHDFPCFFMFFSMMFYSSIWLIPPISRLILVFQHGNAKQLVFSSQPRKADWRGASYRSKNFMGFPEQDWMILVIASWGCFRILNMGLCIQIIVDLIPPIFCWSEWSEASMMFNSSMFGLVKKQRQKKHVEYSIQLL